MTGSLAHRLRRGERLRWIFVKLPCPAEIEQAGYAGFDAVIIDTEHGTADGLEHHLRAADAAGIPALVRVPTLDPAPILRALDGGAAGIVVAHVADAAAARAAVDAAHYPPRGSRGLALTTRAGRYGTAGLADHLARAADETVVVVQIEDAAALPCLAEIVAVPGVDAVLIGSADLSLSLGGEGVEAAIGAIEAAAADAGVPVCEVVGAAAGPFRGSQVVVFVATLLIRDAFRAAGPEAGDGSAPSGCGGMPDPVVLLGGMLATDALWDSVAERVGDSAPLLELRAGRIDLDASVAEMAESVLAAAPERFALAGHSLGGIVALEVVRRAPRRVTRLALLGTSALPPSDAQLAAWDALEERARSGDFAGLASDFAAANLPSGTDASLVAAVREMALACGPDVLLRQLVAQRTRPDARPGLGAIHCPTLIVSGADDAVCPPVRQDEIAAGIAGARLERLEGIGHMSPIEAPERVAALLADWAP